MTSTGVYIRDEQYAWIPAKLLSQNDGIAKVIPDGEEEREVKLNDYESSTLPLQNVKDDGDDDGGGELMVVEDMRDLPSLHEPAILYNLKARHEQTIPYTRVGDIIIAMNPFQWIEGLYSKETQKHYADSIIFQNQNSLDYSIHQNPHIYETSSKSYQGLAKNGTHQSILVSGESGAGKTETVKLVMSHLASIQESVYLNDDDDSDDDDSDDDSDIPTTTTTKTQEIIQRVIDANILLEAFGNAKTVRNDNSSRFGKYIQLQFDVEDSTSAAFAGKSIPTCLLAGSVNDTYLLEKTRVVSHEMGERNYHIFYQLLSDNIEMEELKREVWEDGLLGGGGGVDTFPFVGGNGDEMQGNMNDASRFQSTISSLRKVGIDNDDLHNLLRGVCCVMQLGNIKLQPDSGAEGCIISDRNELDRLSQLIQMDDASIIEKAITHKTVTVGRESYSKPQSLVDATNTLHGFAKELYNLLFQWLVQTMNDRTCAELNYNQADQVSQYGIIGLLDIFGFESFKVNRFEQLCINYTNEKLQQVYILDVFRSIQEEYEMEGLSDVISDDLTYDDNDDVLHLIEGRMGIIQILNEECIRPNGNDVTFVSKLESVNKDSIGGCFQRQRLDRPYEFRVEHYAGMVKYDATNFVNKNTDVLSEDVWKCALQSNNELIRSQFQRVYANTNKPPTSPSAARRRKKSNTPTITTKFRSQLNTLMTNIAQTRTRYIRCIKPNPQKQPLKMDLMSSVEQLRCAGVVAAVTITRLAFPNRLDHASVLRRFGFLSSEDVYSRYDEEEEVEDEEEDDEEKKMDDKEEASSSSKRMTLVNNLMMDLLQDHLTIPSSSSSSPFAIGTTRVYFRTGILEHLESRRTEAFASYSTLLTKIIRGYLQRLQYERMRHDAIVIQSYVRRFVQQTKYHQWKQAQILISCWMRIILAKRTVVHKRRFVNSVKIQTIWRIYVDKTKFLKYKQSAIIIQSHVRGLKWRKICDALMEKSKLDQQRQSKVRALSQTMRRLSSSSSSSMLASALELKKELGDDDDDYKGDEDGMMSAGGMTESERLGAIKEMTSLGGGEEILDDLQQEVNNLTKQNQTLQNQIESYQQQISNLTKRHESTEAKLVAIKKESDKRVLSLEQELKEAKRRNGVNVIVMQRERKVMEEKHMEEVMELKRLLEESRKDDGEDRQQKKKKKSIFSRKELMAVKESGSRDVADEEKKKDDDQKKKKKKDDDEKKDEKKKKKKKKKGIFSRAAVKNDQNKVGKGTVAGLMKLYVNPSDWLFNENQSKYSSYYSSGGGRRSANKRRLKR